ncbi:condensation domain-containing protein [Actinocrispum wychmicini]|uniref:condensation domain-containing protein n=1 Tax=Actinocrispum wychmicini TaxID=1213861 RepID=UPI002442CF04|nr:condensation domain-containing protein [Actinocrispum wychmicini]
MGDNFFELGGDSIQAMLIAARAARHGIKLKLRAVFEHQTLASLARSATTDATSETEDLSFGDAGDLTILPGVHFDDTPAEVRRTFAGAMMMAPTTPMQAGMLFQTHAFPTKGMYLLQLRYALPTDIDAEALRSAWQATVAAFSILRTSFTWDDNGQTIQVIWPAATIPFHLVNWTEVDSAELDDRYAALLDSDREAGVDIERAPLSRITLIHRPDRRYEMVWTYHHALLDGWSHSIVLGVLTESYQRIRAGLPVDKVEAVPFVRYIDWRARQDHDEALKQWTYYLEDFTGSRGIPLPPCARPQHVHETFDLTAAQVDELRAFARHGKVAFNLLFQAVWAVMLAEHTGEQDVLFGMTVAGRPPDLAGVEQMVGMLINTLPVRVWVEPDWEPMAWLHSIHDSQLRVRDHDWIPQPDLTRLLRLSRGAPPFESFVSIEDYPRNSGAEAGLAAIGAQPLNGIIRHSVPIMLGVVPHGDGVRVHLVLPQGDPRWTRALLNRYREALLSLPHATQVAELFAPVT